MGIFKVAFGTYDDASSTGGDINTGLNKVYFFWCQGSSNAVIASATAVNESLAWPLPSTVTIVTTGNTGGGYWFAIGV